MDSLHLGSVNSIDIVIIVIFLISIVIGLARGLVKEVLALLVLIAAFLVAIAFTHSLADYFSHTTAIQNMLSSASSAGATQTISYMTICISFLILFVGTLIVGSIIKFFVSLMLSMTGLGFFNRLLGAIFGFIRAYLLIIAVVFLIQLSPLAKESWWQKSQYVPLFQPQAAWLASIVSPKLEGLKSTVESTVQSGTNAIKP